MATDYALVIGINTYSPSTTSGSLNFPLKRNIKNLNGAVNDAKNITLLLNANLGFKKENIHLLTEKDATRSNILTSLANLSKEVKDGDKFVFYFAGHGTQIRNSLSSEPDKLDECLVPQDAYMGTGYVRDKELKYYFSLMGKKGVVMTLIFDCCHSGSIHRSFQSSAERFTSPDLEMDAKDAGVPETLEKYNILVLSASQDFQTAGEFVDVDNKSYGAFTYAFLKVVQSAGSELEVSELFKRLKLNLRNMGFKQEPVLVTGDLARTHSNIVGDSIVKVLENKIQIIDRLSNDLYVSNFGVFNGGYKGLTFSDSSRNCSLVLDSLIGLTESTLKLVPNKNCAISTYSNIQVTGTPYSPQKIKLFFPLSNENSAASNYMGAKNTVKLSTSIDNADYIIVNDEGKSIVYNLINNKRESIEQPFLPGKSANLFLTQSFLPSNKEEIQKIIDRYNFEYTNDITQADLFLFPERNGHQKVIQLVEMKKGKRIFKKEFNEEVDGSKRLSSDIDQLLQSYYQLNYWSNIESLSAADPFVYDLKIELAPNDSHLLKYQIFNVGQKFGLVLKLNHHLVHHFFNQGQQLPQYYIYILHLGNDGVCQLLYPLHGNLDNRFPLKSFGKIDPVIRLTSNDMFETSLPEGVDSFILLYTSEPIQDFNLFNDNLGTRSNSAPLSLSKIMSTKYRSREAKWGLSKIQFETRIAKN